MTNSSIAPGVANPLQNAISANYTNTGVVAVKVCTGDFQNWKDRARFMRVDN
jgi:hypothetical protein